MASRRKQIRETKQSQTNDKNAVESNKTNYRFLKPVNSKLARPRGKKGLKNRKKRK